MNEAKVCALGGCDQASGPQYPTLCDEHLFYACDQGPDCGGWMVDLWREFAPVPDAFFKFVGGCNRGHVYCLQVGGHTPDALCANCQDQKLDREVGEAYFIYSDSGYCSMTCREQDAAARTRRMVYLALNGATEVIDNLFREIGELALVRNTPKQ